MIRTLKTRFEALTAFLVAIIVLILPWLEPAGAEELPYHRLVILGDPHLPGRLVEKKEAVREAINSWEDVEMVIAVGDICSDWGSDEEYRESKDFFSRLKKPFFPIAGNHDYIYETPAGPDGGLVVAPREIQEAKLKKFRETFNLPDYFYAMAVGNFRLIFLSSDHIDFLSGMSERQLVWFRAELEANRKTPVIVIFHGPLKGTLKDYRRWINTPGFIAQPYEKIHDLLKQNPQVFMWVSGHTHTPPMEESFASPINVYEGQVTNIHNKDMNRGDIWTNSLFLYPDKVVVKTWDHQVNAWLPHLERTIVPPKL